MTSEWTELTDEKLADVAQQGMQGEGASVEAMRRLRVAVEKSSARSDTFSQRMLWLTVILAVLTLVQAIAAVPIIRAWLH
jgi:hypothetical protein